VRKNQNVKSIEKRSLAGPITSKEEVGVKKEERNAEKDG
jgi:hypothetical protein